MYTKIIFFDKFQNSLQGLKRGTIAFNLILLFSSIWYSSMKNFYKKYMTNTDKVRIIVGQIMTALILCSMIGVQISNSWQESMVYGALVGFSLFGGYNFINLTVNDKWDYNVVAVDTLYGIISMSLVSLIVFLLTKPRVD
jgi:uncharacterized membrane protein